MRTRTLFAVAMVLGALVATVAASSAAAYNGEITGRVTDEDGNPIAGISVCAHNNSPLVHGECDFQTDSNGEYAITGLQEASFQVEFHVESDPALNYVQQWWEGKAHPEESQAVLVTEGETTTGIDAVMEAGGELTGTVTDRETGEPIEGVDVCPLLVDRPENAVGEVTYCGMTDAAGDYTVRNLGTGEYEVRFDTGEGPNYVAETRAGDVSVTAGQTTPGIDAELQPGLAIEGEVTEAATGLAAPWGTTVCAFELVTERRVGCVPSKLDGSYALSGLQPGSYVVGFSVDLKEDEVDIHPDGFVRRFWDEVQNFGEATPVGSSTPTVITGIDAALVAGEEVWPAADVAPVQGTSSTTTTYTRPISVTPGPARSKPVTCKKGFHKLKMGGHPRCVKIHKKKHHKRKHHEPAHQKTKASHR